MGKMKKKYSSGTAKVYVTRNKALRKLQLSLADFRRLCILKGVYPVEPRSLKKASKGAPKQRTFFHRHDIRYLLHEPVINTFRQLKIYSRKLNKYKHKHDRFQFERIERAGKPQLTLDHIILERYPKFSDALNDLDDCLCLVILYATYPMDEILDSEFVAACRRLTVEFMNYVMATRSLRKCFISFKGFYLQASIQGRNVTWIMPHQVGYSQPFKVDLKIMGTFLEFYVQMLGFVNFKLYNDARLVYPPSFSFHADTNMERMINQQEFFEEMLSSFNMDIQRKNAGDDYVGDFDDAIPSADLDNLPELQRLFYEKLNSPSALRTLSGLFEGLKIFVNVEVPLEVFAFAVRSCGGEVSWPSGHHCGETFAEDDPSVTHQLIDRPIEFESRVINRHYVQPQWVFDCINFRRLVPAEQYRPGFKLPPHFSPFVNERPGEYVSPDKLRLLGIEDKEIERLVESNRKSVGGANGLAEMGAEERKLREAMMPKKLKRIYKKAVHAKKKERKKTVTMVSRRKEADEKKTDQVKRKPNMEKKRRRKKKQRQVKLAARIQKVEE
ncbi:hypothetical protein ACOME3_004468 [Neoechinorhynchus agilis]